MANGSTAGERQGIGETESERGGALGSFGGETRGSTAAQRRGIGETTAQRGGEFGAFAGEEQESSIGRKIKDFFKTETGAKVIGAGVGFFAGPIIGLDPLSGAKIGAGIARRTFEEEPGAPTAAAPTIAQAAPSVTPQDISAQKQFTDIGQLGGDGRQVVAPPPVSRESGIQPQLAALGQQLPQQQFLNQGGILSIEFLYLCC